MSNAFFLWGSGATIVSAGALALWRPAIAVGALVGGIWNLASLWCFGQLLRAWLGPHSSRRRVVLWLLVKFPLLYLLVGALLYRRLISLLGFGIGFSLVLVLALGWWLRSAARLSPVRSNGP